MWTLHHFLSPPQGFPKNRVAQLAILHLILFRGIVFCCFSTEDDLSFLKFDGGKGQRGEDEVGGEGAGYCRLQVGRKLILGTIISVHT